MARLMRTRLSVMMFLQYAVPGVIMPIISHYLKNYLHFQPFQVGEIMAMTAVAAIVAPFFVVMVADRYISAERLLALCHFLAGAVMLALAHQNRFGPFLIVYFAYGLLFAPTFALTNAVAFHHLTDAKREFGAVRMWGPVSWVVVGWGFSMLWLRLEPSDAPGSRLPDALILSALSSFVLGTYSLSLPKSPVAAKSASGLMPWKTIRVFARPSLALLCVLTFVNQVVHQFYYYGMSPYLSQIGFTNKAILPAMSMGQLGEVFTLLLLGKCLARLGVKRALIAGVLAQIARCMIFAHCGWPWVLAIIPSHGICYAFFFTVAFIYVDSHSSAESRAGAQQLFNILISGFGTLAGNLFAGKMAELFTLPGTTLIDFRMFWWISAGMALAITAILALFFKEEAAKSASASETLFPRSSRVP